MGEMKLTRDERKAIGAGANMPLIRETEPDCDLGQRMVLSWSRPRRSSDEGIVFRPPPQPLLTILITRITRRKKGGWAVYFEISDYREPHRFLRAKPPVYSRELMQRDQHRPPSEQEIADAREESHYTSNPNGAVDQLEAVDDITLGNFAKEARRQERDSLGELFAACEDVRSAIRERIESNPEFLKTAGREVWLLRSRLDALERKIKRQAAA